MWGEVTVLIVCVCVCVSVTTLVAHLENFIRPFRRNVTPTGHYNFSKTVGGSNAASGTTNYRQLSGKLSIVVY